MSPKSRNSQTEAEKFFEDWDRHRASLRFGQHPDRKSNWHPSEIAAIGKLLDPTAECVIDAPLTATIAEGHLIDDFAGLRQELACLMAEAYSATSFAFGAQVRSQTQRGKRENATSLLVSLREFVVQIDEEVDQVDERHEKTGAELTNDDRSRVDDLRSIVADGESLIARLDAYAKTEPDENKQGNRTNHRAVAFFSSFADWWNRAAIGQPDHARTHRDQLAEALWCDFGQSVRDGYAPGEFASYYLGK